MSTQKVPAALLESGAAASNIGSGGVTASMLASDSVETAKIKDLNVTTAKLAASSVTPAKLSQPLTIGTAQATTSGNAVTFDSIPAWATRIVVTFSGVSLTDIAYIKLVLGVAGGLETSGYVGAFGTLTDNSAAAVLDLSSSFIVAVTAGNGSAVSGSVTLTLMDAATNTWACHGAVGRTAELVLHTVAGAKPLAGALTQVAVTTTGTFDAGKVNILYE